MAGAAALKYGMPFDEAWSILQEEAINKLIDGLEIEGLPNNKIFTSDEYMRLYTVVYNVASKEPIGPEAEKMYDGYQRTLEDYVSSKVLPSLRGKENENLLQELLRRWNIYKTLTRWLSRFFNYLSRYYIPIKRLPSLVRTSYLTFYDQVYGEIKEQVSNAVVLLIGKEREGEQIDQGMVKQVLNIFGEIGEDALKNYAEHIQYEVDDTKLKFNTTVIDFYMSSVKEYCRNEKNAVSKYVRLTNMDEILEIYEKIEDRVCDSILSLERDNQIEGNNFRIHWDEQVEQFAQSILKIVRQIFKEIGDDALKIYAKDIEEALVGATALFYSKKSIEWIATESYEGYMLKVEESLEKEKSRFTEYLKPIKTNRLLEVVQHELLNAHANKLEEKEATLRLKCLKL